MRLRLPALRVCVGIIPHSHKNIMIAETKLPITEALRGVDTVTCATPEEDYFVWEDSHMRTTGES